MKLKFNRSRFDHQMSIFSSILVTWIGFIVLPILILLTIYYLPNEISKNPLALKRPMDYFFTFIWFFSGISPIFLLKIFWKKPIYKYFSTFSLFSTSMFVASLVPLFVKRDSEPTAVLIRKFVSNTNTFFIVLILSMIICYFGTLIIVKPLFIKSPWWGFIYFIPYMIVSWKLSASYSQIDGLIKNKDFSYQKASQMLNSFPQEQLTSINPLWFEAITLSIGILILSLGGIFSAYIWKKTQNWRKEEKEEG